MHVLRFKWSHRSTWQLDPAIPHPSARCLPHLSFLSSAKHPFTPSSLPDELPSLSKQSTWPISPWPVPRPCWLWDCSRDIFQQWSSLRQKTSRSSHDTCFLTLPPTPQVLTHKWMGSIHFWWDFCEVGFFKILNSSGNFFVQDQWAKNLPGCTFWGSCQVYPHLLCWAETESCMLDLCPESGNRSANNWRSGGHGEKNVGHVSASCWLN